MPQIAENNGEISAIEQVSIIKFRSKDLKVTKNGIKTMTKIGSFCPVLRIFLSLNNRKREIFTSHIPSEVESVYSLMQKSDQSFWHFGFRLLGVIVGLDVLIIGGGVAGISAAFWCNELGLSSIILESENELGGQLLWTYNAIKNHLGIQAENGRELQQIFLKQAENFKFAVQFGAKIDRVDIGKTSVIFGNGEVLTAKFLIIATGIRRRKLGISGEENFIGKGILKSGKRDSETVRGKKVCVVGGGDAALENALILSETAENVTLIHRRNEFRARKEFIDKVKANPKIEIFTETEITKFIGNKTLESIELKDIATNKLVIYPTDAILLRIGVQPNNELIFGQLELDEKGYCKIDSSCETSAKNIFAIGDIANPIAPTISSAIGMGATAAKVIADRI